MPDHSLLFICVGVAGGVVIAALALFFLLRRSSSIKCAKYCELMRGCADGEDVKLSLVKASMQFPEKSLEKLAIDKAIMYLNRSILRDYETAFKIIESVFTNKQVRELHDAILKERAKHHILLLSGKSESSS